jgi:hypothetical protein
VLRLAAAEEGERSGGGSEAALGWARRKGGGGRRRRARSETVFQRRPRDGAASAAVVLTLALVGGIRQTAPVKGARGGGRAEGGRQRRDSREGGVQPEVRMQASSAVRRRGAGPGVVDVVVHSRRTGTKDGAS